MDDEIRKKIQDASRIIIHGRETSQPLITAQILCQEEAKKLLSDFVVCYDDGSNSDQMNLLYGAAVELLSLWKNNGQKIHDDLELRNAL